MIDFIASAFLVPNYSFVLTVWNSVMQVLPIVLIATVIQIIFLAIKRRPKLFSYEMVLDLVYVIQPSLIYLSVLGITVASATTWLSGSGEAFFPEMATFPLWLQVLLAVWMFDFLVYWRHRIEHESSILWPFHAVHHSCKQIDVLSTTRLHIGEVMLGGIINGFATIKCGLTPEATSMGFMFYLYYNYFIHTNINFKFPGILKYVLVSPLMHRWHHAVEREAINKNYAVVFAWNDWLFRTAYLPNHEPLEYGFKMRKNEALSESYCEQQLYPLTVLKNRIAKRFFNKECN